MENTKVENKVRPPDLEKLGAVAFLALTYLY